MIREINTNNLQLVKPTMEYKEQVMNYKKIFLERNEILDGCLELEECGDYEEWLKFDKRLARKYGTGYIPSTIYLAIRRSDCKLVGIISFRHRLSTSFLRDGGNIRYSVLPNEREKGYAKEMLGKMLEYCTEMGIHRVLLTCNKDDVAPYKTIKSNGGILENEIIENIGSHQCNVIQRYWISTKKRYADRVKNDKSIEKVEMRIKEIKNSDFDGDIYFHNFLKVLAPLVISKDICIRNNNHKWLEFYDYKSKIKLTAMYDENDEILQWYFDIAREIGKESEIPYEDDLYLDVVLTPEGEILLLDEQELKDALDRNEISKNEYKEAYRLANDLINKIKGRTMQVKQFTDKYLREIEFE